MSTARSTLRGLTLVEVVLALSIISAVAASSAAWVQLVAGTALEHRAVQGWLSAAMATLQVIADDLAAGDHSVTEKNPPVVTFEGSTLTIPTRSPASGGCRAEYRLDAVDGTLYRRIITESGTEENRPVLSELRGWEVALDVDSGVLTIVLESLRVGRGEMPTSIARGFAIESRREER